jgi:PTH1 family peptidyl-tRNA hydrolase
VLNRLRPNRRRHDDQPPTGEVYLIVGLGNPGRRYQGTRHNLGFMTVDRIYDRLPRGSARSRFQADYVETRDGDRRVVLIKPQTFMNESGAAVGQLARWFKVPTDGLLVIYDELDLPFGQIRLRASGSDGGHNGVASVIQHLRTQEFARLRIGISRPRTGSTVPYVLSPFSPSEQHELSGVIDRAADAALAWLRIGITAAMNEHNRRPGTPTTSVAAASDPLPED